MNRTNRFGRAATCWWSVVVFVALGALVFVRHAGAGTALELPEAWSDTGAKYICLGSVAVRLGDEPSATGWRELFRSQGYQAQKADAQERCRVSVVPQLPGADVLASLTWPQSGYTALVQRVPGSGPQALARLKAEMVSRGWVETGGSRLAWREHRSFPGVAHERAGGWIHTVVVDDPGYAGVLLVTSGQLARVYFFVE